MHTLNACNLMFPCWKMYVGCMTIHELFFYLFFSKECVYKYMKFDFVFVLRMHVKMHEICLNMNFWFSSFWKMHIRMHEICLFFVFFLWRHEILLIEFENACLNAWNLIFFCYVLDDAFMNALNFWLNLNFWFEWKCMFEYIKF